MLPVNCPSGAYDAAALKTLGKRAEWATHIIRWQAAYAAYLACGGDPHVISPAVFVPDVSVAQRDLYDSRKSRGPLRRLRDTAGLPCCPMCGSGSTGHLDHYLPRGAYPEFSIFTANLVPACQHCNSSGKATTFKGTAPERFIHPYFDTLADRALWRVRFIAPLPAVNFEIEVEDWLNGDARTRVLFHLKHVLGGQFQMAMRTRWSRLPIHILHRSGDALSLNEAVVTREIAYLSGYSETSHGLNSWEAAFYRGLDADPTARRWILHAAVSSAGGALVQQR